MTFKGWKQWGKRPNEDEKTLEKRADGTLPEMESTKQLVKLVSEIYKKEMRILDVGCNVGHYLRGIRRKIPNAKYTGVDAYEHYIEKAKIFPEVRRVQHDRDGHRGYLLGDRQGQVRRGDPDHHHVR